MQRNYMDRIGDTCALDETFAPMPETHCEHGYALTRDCYRCEHKCVTFVEVAAAVKALRPVWRVDEDYPDVVSIYPDYSEDCEAFVVGTANETWAADFYPDRHSHESGRCFVGFDTGIGDDSTDVELVAKAIVEEVEYYMERRPVRGELLDALRAFRKAAHAVDEAWNNLDTEDSSALADRYPFPQSFDEMVEKIDEWVKEARGALNDEVEE